MTPQIQCILPMHFPESNDSSNDAYSIKSFSAGGSFIDIERCRLEKKYSELVKITEILNRKSASYQASKKDPLHSLIRYKEGFSSDLVKFLINECGLSKGQTVLDPFAGSGTTAMTASENGINSIGYDVMPFSKIILEAKKNFLHFDIAELRNLSSYVATLHRPSKYAKSVLEITITKGAYPGDTGKDIAFLSESIKSSNFSENAKNLAELCILKCLETVSYTAKDGQYLRWDRRSDKVIKANAKRAKKGLASYATSLDKGKLPSIQEAFDLNFKEVIENIRILQERSDISVSLGNITFIQDSSLIGLPLLDSESVNGVITSPPYCNRYDYTRTYALELAYLGVGEEDIRKKRQELLSCTVENKPKTRFLEEYYKLLNKSTDFSSVMQCIENCSALNEIMRALEFRKSNGEVNNSGILSMVKGYFHDLAFIFYEIFRICTKGSRVAFVNDNVRYAGEIIPVDFLSTTIAESIGFRPIKVLVLKQQKGNSSQQMKKFGRAALRKSITIWEKP
ncbi:MAG: site-specific DNA-methyltransferase [Oxalobacter formigenes]|nr:site-specific DNA-methyltransferase [Oxalobacter formigenes]